MHPALLILLLSGYVLPKKIFLLNTKQVRIRFFSALLIVFLSFGMNFAFAESGVPDPKPTTCGKMPCAWFVGKYLFFGDVDDYSMEHSDKLPKSSKFDNIHISAFVGGWVAYLASTMNGTSVMPYKAVITGADAKYSQFPVAGVTFSLDRRTVYFSKEFQSGGQFNIELISSGIVNISTYLEISDGTYSTSAIDVGEIIVSPRSDALAKKQLAQETLTLEIKKRIDHLARIRPELSAKLNTTRASWLQIKATDPEVTFQASYRLVETQVLAMEKLPLICKKGGITKKVYGQFQKCPTGYKIK